LLGKGCGKSFICNQGRTKMANLRQEDKPTQVMEDAARRAGEKAADQTSRIGQATADQTARMGKAAAQAGEEVAKASADLLRQNAEALQHAWRFGLEAATSVMGRSTEQFGRTLGVSGEGVQQASEATERSARNAQTIIYTGSAAAKVVGGMSREYLQMVQHQVEKNMNHMTELWACRTPQDFAAVQSDMVRETAEAALECSRKIADMSLKMAEDAGKQIKQNMEEDGRAA
jgi:phasin family protein